MAALGIKWDALIFQLIAFIMLILILWRYAYRPVLNVLDQRAARIRQSMEQADRIERQLAETEQRNQEILAEARREAQSIVAQAREVADAHVAKAREAAHEEAEKQLQQSLAQLRAEEERVKTELRQQAADLVILAASKVVRRELDPQKHYDLIDETLREAAGEQAAVK
ncbi:MAG TPA: F0F1 ATP synthase subunit B [Thermomicrobiales bacterium]|nr:F0F1 ATP synthase subunit B [Thermomicrobiales bacterium]